MLALTATFSVSNLSLAFELKTSIFLAITFSYLTFCLLLYLRESRTAQPTGIFTVDTEEKLLALEEASMFFGASLKPNEMFRLVASRINELVPFAACVLFLPDENNAYLCAAQATGDSAEKFNGLRIISNEACRGRPFLRAKSSWREIFCLKKILSAKTFSRL